MPGTIRVSGQDIRRDIFREVPSFVAIADRKLNRSEITRVIAVTRPDDDRDDVIGFDADLLKRSDRSSLGSIQNTRGQLLGRVAATNFQRPGHAIAAFRMSMLELSANAQLR